MYKRQTHKLQDNLNVHTHNNTNVLTVTHSYQTQSHTSKIPVCDMQKVCTVYVYASVSYMQVVVKCYILQ